MPLDFDAINAGIGTATDASETALTNHIATMDPDSSQDLMTLQYLLQEWSVRVGAQTSCIAKYGQTLNGITQKM